MDLCKNRNVLPEEQDLFLLWKFEKSYLSLHRVDKITVRAVDKLDFVLFLGTNDTY